MEELDQLLEDLNNANLNRKSYRSSVGSNRASLIGLNLNDRRSTMTNRVSNSSGRANFYQPNGHANNNFIEQMHRLVNLTQSVENNENDANKLRKLSSNSMVPQRQQSYNSNGVYGDLIVDQSEQDYFNKRISTASSSSNYTNDLTELDNLLEDLYKAKVNLSLRNSLKTSSRDSNEINMLNLSNPLSTISSSSSSSSSSEANSGASITNQNNDDHTMRTTLVNGNSGAILGKHYQTSSSASSSSSPISNSSSSAHLQSSSSSSSSAHSSKPNSSYYSPNNVASLLNRENSHSLLSNSGKSIEKLMDLIDSDNNSAKLNEKPSIKANTDDATRELEDLMTSLSMYKNDSRDSYASSLNDKLNQRHHDSACSEHSFPNCSKSIDENLQYTRSKNNIYANVNQTFNRNLCYACQQPINGQVITALGYMWHPEHFVCYSCNTTIGTNVFYEKDNKPYCEKDYLELFSPKCAACTRPILDKMLTALDKSWHINCFVCHSCKKTLNDESFLEMNNSAYCKECYVNKLAPKCKSCQGAIVENFISALDAYWHPSCFVCQECGLQFNSSSFFEYDHLPYCEIHYHLRRGSLCSSCQMPINGRCITAMNKKFHPEHFTCSFCLKHLNKGTFKEQNDKPYCHTCYQKLFP